MTTNYPGSLDSFTTNVDNVDQVTAADVNNLQDAVVAIETELSTQPRHTATAAPTVNDDTGDGYSVGTHWYDTTNDMVYVAIDVTAGAAIWHKIAAPWTNWTPTVTQLGSVTVTVVRAKYKIVNKICFVEARLNVTGSGTTNNAIVIAGQPAAIQATTGAIIGIYQINDAGTTRYSGVVESVGATDWEFFSDNLAGAAGVTPNFALANNDVIRFSCTYEVA